MSVLAFGLGPCPAFARAMGNLQTNCAVLGHCADDCPGGGDVEVVGFHQEKPDDPEELAKAAVQGDLVRLQIAIMSGAAIESRHLGIKGVWSNEDMTPLMLAATSGHGKCATVLLEAKAAVDAKTCTGKSALHFAAAQGGFEMGRLLIQHGADKTLRDSKGRRAPAFLQASRGMTLEVWRTEFRQWLTLLQIDEDEARQAANREAPQESGPFIDPTLRRPTPTAAALIDAAALAQDEQSEVLDFHSQVRQSPPEKLPPVVPPLGAAFPHLGQPCRKNYEVD